jgi:dUTP pyrophosphatase
MYNRNHVPRGFEIARGFEGRGIILPSRSTCNSAGYDFHAIDNVIIIPHEAEVLHTGIKAFMQPDEFLMLVVRSSLGIKRGIILGGAISVIDADYYGNVTNDGEILIPLRNLGPSVQQIRKGERIAQGIFMKDLTCGDEPDTVRTGGIGSSNIDKDI